MRPLLPPLPFAIGVLVVILALFSGCEQVRVHFIPAHISGFSPQPDLSKLTHKTLRQAYGEEWRLANTDAPPHLCLALSGGGIRAAAFGLGILRGFQKLDRPGVPLKFNVISAVSGGAYTLSWYYMQHLATPDADTQSLLADSDRVNKLEDKAGLVSRPEYAAFAASNLLFTPINLLVNGLFGWHWNTTPSRAWYEARIRATFLDNQTLTLPQIRALVENRHLPLMIINATAYIDDDRNYHGAKLSNSVFEFTPLWYGSDAFGYSSTFPDDMDLARVVSISGAGVDSSTIAGSSQKTFGSLLNTDLGFYIDNFSPNVTVNMWSRMIPFPGYLLTREYLRSPDGARIYLTDGGHSDNLGAFSLIRRLCSRIVIVDSEHDPQYRFGGYFRLRDALKREMGVDMSVPEIDAIRHEGEWCRYTGGGKKHCGEARPGESRSLEWSTRFWSTGWKPENPFIKNMTPVMEGYVRGFLTQATDDSPVRRKDLHVIYIKLSLDVAKLSTYDPLIRGYHHRSLRAKRGRVSPENPTGCTEDRGYLRLLILGCAFPQEPTTDQDFSARQFSAYRMLGEDIVEKHVQDRLTTLFFPMQE